MAWLAEHSERCINLERVWNEQRISPALCDALKVVCAAAHKHITSQDGNPGEASKREFCWIEFRDKKLSEPKEWRDELSETAFIIANTEEEALSAEWERVRHGFLGDLTTLEQIAVRHNKSVSKSLRDFTAHHCAACSWEELKKHLKGGVRKLRPVVELFSAAAAKR